jgi:hypothetical protein
MSVRLTPAAAAVYQQILSLAAADRRLLLQALEGSTSQLEGYAVVPAEVLPFAVDCFKRTLTLLRKKSNEAHRRGKCASARKVVDERNRIIASLLEQGITDPQLIWQHLLEHYPQLIQKRKARNGKPAEYTTAEMMMKRYQAPIRPKNNCKESD